MVGTIEWHTGLGEPETRVKGPSRDMGLLTLAGTYPRAPLGRVQALRLPDGTLAYNVTPKDFHEVVRRISERMNPKVADTFLRAFTRMRDGIDLSALASALGSGNLSVVEGQVAASRLVTLLSGSNLGDVLQSTATLTGKEAADVLADVLGVRVAFNARDLNVVQYARTHTANLIVGVSDSVKETVRIITAAGADFGLTTDQQARLIRETVGLPPNWARAPLNFEQELRDGRPNLGRRLSATDKAQIRSRIAKGMVDDAFVRQMRERYTQSLINRRALNIARTETMRAANAGQRLSWSQAQREKLLPKTAKRVWIVTPDDRLRETHAAVPEMNPEGVDVDSGVYETPLGPADGPPLETNCRCAEGLIFPQVRRGLERGPAPAPTPDVPPPVPAPSPDTFPAASPFAQPPTRATILDDGLFDSQGFIQDASHPVHALWEAQALSMSQETFVRRMVAVPDEWSLWNVNLTAFGDKSLRVQATMLDAQGQAAGGVIRQLDFVPKSVTHDWFALEARHQGTGVAKRVLSQQVALYQELGFTKVSLHANLDVGGYAWVRYGFTPRPSEWNILSRSLQQSLGFSNTALRREFGDDLVDKAFDLLKVNSPEPNTLRLLAQNPVGKKLLLGTSWDGALDLADEAAMQMFWNYAGR